MKSMITVGLLTVTLSALSGCAVESAELVVAPAEQDYCAPPTDWSQAESRADVYTMYPPKDVRLILKNEDGTYWTRFASGNFNRYEGANGTVVINKVLCDVMSNGYVAWRSE